MRSLEVAALRVWLWVRGGRALVKSVWSWYFACGIDRETLTDAWRAA